MKTAEQERAKRAFEFVSQVLDNEKIKKDYLGTVRKIPQMITYNGLITTLAFLKSKENHEDYKMALNHLTEYLCEKLGIENDYRKLLETLYESPLEKYMFITQEAIYFSIWLKRIAEGEIKDESKGD